MKVIIVVDIFYQYILTIFFAAKEWNDCSFKGPTSGNEGKDKYGGKIYQKGCWGNSCNLTCMYVVPAVTWIWSTKTSFTYVMTLLMYFKLLLASVYKCSSSGLMCYFSGPCFMYYEKMSTIRKHFKGGTWGW